ncbi:hypothetical protein PRJ_Fausto_00313 [Faustovirus]|nr:hypothetical protein PRJ_Fausto_00313 [Faustovirus]QBR99220.1 hypothetical protein [Faustovirus mariensis]
MTESLGFDANFNITRCGLYSPVYNHTLIISKKGIDISMDSTYKHMMLDQSGEETVYWYDQVDHFDFMSKLKTTLKGDNELVLEAGFKYCNIVFHLAHGVKYTVYTSSGYFFEVEVLGDDTRVPKMVNSVGLMYYMGCVWGEARARASKINSIQS